MAGIGFRLNKYFNSPNLLSKFQGCVYSVVISSGPWLISVLTIALISAFGRNFLETQDLLLLKSIICYTYATSLIFFGAIEMPITRYLADQLYKNDYSTITDLFLVLLAFSILAGSGLGYTFYSFFPEMEIKIKIFSVLLFISILMVWVSMIFLSASKMHHEIVISFFLGAISSVVLAFILKEYNGIEGFLIGYSFGQFLIAFILIFLVLSEYRSLDYFSLEFLNYFVKHKYLVLSGIFYYLGIWIDKFIYWFGENGELVEGLFYTNRYYDTASFLAYISIVPALAIFLVEVETKFYKNYFFYFYGVEERNSLSLIDDNLEDIFDTLSVSFMKLIRFQLIFTSIIWYFAEDILGAFGINTVISLIFQYHLIGAMAQSFFLVINIILLYFLAERRVMFHYGLFFTLNGLFTFFLQPYGLRFQGLGFAAASLITFIVSLSYLNHRLRDLNYSTFMSQRISFN